MSASANIHWEHYITCTAPLHAVTGRVHILPFIGDFSNSISYPPINISCASCAIQYVLARRISHIILIGYFIF